MQKVEAWRRRKKGCKKVKKTDDDDNDNAKVIKLCLFDTMFVV